MSPKMALVAAVLVALSLSVGETASLDGLSPAELGEDLGESGVSVPVGDVTAMTAKLEAENRALIKQNTALQSQAALASAEQKPGTKPVRAPETKVISKKALPAEVQKGMKVMDDYQQKLSALETKLATETQKVTAMKINEGEQKIAKEEAQAAAAAAKNPKKWPYARVPYFKGFAGSKEVKGLKNVGECQAVCDRQQLCKSFSWTDTSKLCFWSIAGLNYDPHFTMAVKATQDLAGSPGAKFREFPGVKFIDAQSTQVQGSTEAACQQRCDADVSCKSYSYRKDSSFCAYSSKGLAYDEDYMYYEKEIHGVSSANGLAAATISAEKANLKKEIAVSEKKASDEASKEKRADEALSKEKAGFVNGVPNIQQEEALKNKVDQVNKANIAKMAAKGAEVAAANAIKAQDKFQKQQLDAVAKLSKIEADGTKAKAGLEEAKKKLFPLKKAVADQEVVITKLGSSLVIAGLDLKTNEAKVAAAEKAVKEATTVGDKAALAAMTEQLNEAKKAIAATEAEQAKIREDIKKAQEELKKRQKTEAAQQKNTTELAGAVESDEAGVKAQVKNEKKALEFQKAAVKKDQEAADAAKMIALTSKEKVQKLAHANAKMEIFYSTEHMKTIKTDIERTELEKKMATARGVIFRAAEANDALSQSMVETARKLAAVKERAHKAAEAVKQRKKDTERRDVTNKLASLEEKPIAKPPVSV